jgi:hypothetical protein
MWWRDGERKLFISAIVRAVRWCSRVPSMETRGSFQSDTFDPVLVRERERIVDRTSGYVLEYLFRFRVINS